MVFLFSNWLHSYATLLRTNSESVREEIVFIMSEQCISRERVREWESGPFKIDSRRRIEKRCSWSTCLQQSNKQPFSPPIFFNLLHVHVSQFIFAYKRTGYENWCISSQWKRAKVVKVTERVSERERTVTVVPAKIAANFVHCTFFLQYNLNPLNVLRLTLSLSPSNRWIRSAASHSPLLLLLLLPLPLLRHVLRVFSSRFPWTHESALINCLSLTQWPTLSNDPVCACLSLSPANTGHAIAWGTPIDTQVKRLLL